MTEASLSERSPKVESPKWEMLNTGTCKENKPSTDQKRTAPLQPTHQPQNTHTPHGQHNRPHLVPFSGCSGVKVVNGLLILCSTYPHSLQCGPEFWVCPGVLSTLGEVTHLATPALGVSPSWCPSLPASLPCSWPAKHRHTVTHTNELTDQIARSSV